MYYRDENNEWQEIILEPSGDTLPIGTIAQFGGSTVPTNWMFCNGQAVSRETYSELFAVIGETYGEGDGSTTFNLPDFSSRSPMGLGTGTDGTNSETTTLGQEKGEYKHQLTVDELAAHIHKYAQPKYNGTQSSFLKRDGDAGMAGASDDTVSTGGDEAHNTIHPVLGVNFIIKAKQSIGLVGDITTDITNPNEDAVPNASTVKAYVDALEEEITDAEVYSTNEVKTNKVWIDNKHIYRKVVDFTTGSGNNNVILTDSNIDSIVLTDGFINYGSGYHKIGGYANSSYYSLIQWNTSEHKLYIYFNGYTNKNGYVIVEYTKTTD